ncbi:MAG: flagellar hook-associated protein FlgK [Conexibacter sp.]|nr:flagellar hook-associated protein FlgK [Conexibacter sp.]
MPISTFTGIQTALRGMLAEQQALDTTSHNVANSGTKGYSRQQVVLSATNPLVVQANSSVNGHGAQLGTGVDVTAISRIRNIFLDVQYRGQNSTLGDATAASQGLNTAQTAFNEPSTSGIARQLSNFWDAWSTLANTPETNTGAGARQALVTSAGTLASSFRTLSDQLTSDAANAQTQYNALTGANGTVANDAKQLAMLNDAISHATAVGQSPNDLLDQRDSLIDELSSLARVSVTDLGNGAQRIDFGGVTLVDPSATGGYTWPQTLTSPGGQLAALANLASSTGPLLGYRDTLDAIARSLVTAVNTLQPTSPFFDPTGTTAAALAVVATPASVQTGTSGASGDNGLATQIAQLRGGTIDQTYSALIARVGGDVRTSNLAQTTAQSLVDAIDNNRQSVSGVSIEEEVTNLMTFQRGYQAAARAMTTMDDVLDTLINRTGRVGL